MAKPASDIKYLTHEEIDTSMWDQCVRNAPNGWLYARSFFLDGICQWDALVADDYSYILPLPKRKKFGIWYVYIPPFSGQLGIIGSEPVSPELASRFIRSIPESFRLVDMLMNEQNPACSLQEVFSIQRTNYIIPLQDEYASICRRYTKDAQKNIRLAEASLLITRSGISMDKIASMYRTAYGGKNNILSSSDYKRIIALGNLCIEKGNGFTIGVLNPDNELLASAFFGKDEKRVYYILGAPNQLGRKYSAVHCLIDKVIKQYAGTGLVFDFEGSDIPSVAQFYRKFTPMPIQYELIRVNRLAWWMRWLKGEIDQ